VVRRVGGPLFWDRVFAAVVVIAVPLFLQVAGWVVVLGVAAARAIAMLAEDRRLAGVTGGALAE
jgi:hypothetical protein